MAQVGVADWLLLLVAAGLLGFAKTAIGGVGALGVVLFAGVLPAKESTGTVLPLLLVGDVLAVALYRRHADWRLLLRLLPWVAVGVVAGAAFVAVVDDATMKVTIGVVLVLASVLGLGARAPGWRVTASQATANPSAPSLGYHAATGAAGVCAGFATMVANAAGPVMSIYLVLAGLPVLRLLGTAAWFFLAVNLVKLPFSVGLGLVTSDGLLLDASLLPALLVGAGAGVLVVRRISQDRFEVAALVLAGVSAGLLLL
ncbi:MAG: TSUP family transporter [Actinomycetes bacterium]